MTTQKLSIAGIPALLWGKPSDRVFINVHGKLSCKEYAEPFARAAEQKGFQTLSFDLPEHGERSGDHSYRCDIWNGMHDLNLIADHVFPKWKGVGLFACSIGAFFSLNAYAGRPFSQCLFQSPVVDMACLIRQMFEWNGVTEEQLREKGEIPTPLDPLRWDYYQYVLQHPVVQWDVPTRILYGGKDNLQPDEVIRDFAGRFGCRLTVSENSEHAFMAPGDAQIVEHWFREAIE